MSGTGDYISREALLRMVGHRPTTPTTDREDRLISAFISTIGTFPAADARPVVRGKWETVMLDHERMGCRPTAHYCSECHQITWFRTFFCPNCGADMRQEEE